jgi:hypothetical protein
MLKAILSPMGVSINAKVNIGNPTFEVKNCTKLVFTYHPKGPRTTLRKGDQIINNPKKLNDLLSYCGYNELREMYKDFGAGFDFAQDENKLVLYMLEFTEERFKFD